MDNQKKRTTKFHGSKSCGDIAVSGRVMQRVVQTRRATSVCRLRHNRMEQGPTEPHAGRSMFLLSSGGAGGRYYLGGLWYGAHSY